MTLYERVCHLVDRELAQEKLVALRDEAGRAQAKLLAQRRAETKRRHEELSKR